jgi:hypothetical protein
MNARRIIAAAVAAAALLAVNIGVADSASASGTSWTIQGKDAKAQTTKVQTAGTSWT